MKNKIALIAACATALSPIVSSPAFAADPTATNAATMDANCAAYVHANLGSTTESADSTYFGYEVQITGATDAAPQVVPGSRINDDTTWTPDTTSIHKLYGPDASQSTHLTRNGKSPNIFATDVKASSESWSNNSVEYTVETTVTTTFTYQCDVTKYAWTPPVAPTAPSGAIYDYKHKINPGNNDCDKYDGAVYYGQTKGNCVLDSVTYSIPGTDGEEGYFTDVPLGLVGTFDTISQTSDPERGDPIVDPAAGFHRYYATDALGSAVVCNSPGSKGGTWTPQNMYTGLSPQLPCSSATFNALPGGAIPSNSLPVG
jgi:hypothetical protein